MKRAIKKKGGLYHYFDSLKVLEWGSETDIHNARQEYRKLYKAQWRKQKRLVEKEFTLRLTEEESKIITDAAKRHKQSKSRFIKNAAFAYLGKSYIVPDLLEVRRIAQLLAMTYNSIQETINENVLPAQTGKILLEKILDLERNVLISLKYPKEKQ